LTDPADGEALQITDIRSVNLSDPNEMQIGDARRSSYITTARGNQSLEHLIALARAHLMKRARVVEIAFAPKLARMPEITLRKNVFLAEPRVGQALGKVIAYSISLDGADGRINCEIRIGCAIGKGGIITAMNGEPTYCSIDYTGTDYQQFLDRTVLVTGFADSSVGYGPPSAEPNDDGLNLLGSNNAEDFIEVPLSVQHGPEPGEQEEWRVGAEAGSQPENFQAALVEARSEWIKNVVLPQYNTRATFKLKSMTREFSSEYIVPVTQLKIPTGYNLEVV
jgi:hypothetical protein